MVADLPALVYPTKATTGTPSSLSFFFLIASSLSLFCSSKSFLILAYLSLTFLVSISSWDSPEPDILAWARRCLALTISRLTYWARIRSPENRL